MSSAQPDTPWDANPFSHGAAWVRADFHLHTRADKEWRQDDGTKDLRPPHEFVNEYVAELTSATIRIGVITNHNKFDLDEFKKLRKAARKSGIGLLPGVELSVKDGSGVHICLCFNDSWIANQAGRNYIQDFLTAAFAGQPNPENENSSCNYDLETAMRELAKLCNDGRQFFVVFAHVNQKSGLWHEVGRGNRIPEMAAKSPDIWQQCLAFQKVRGVSPEQRGGCDPAVIRQKLGESYLAEVEGSDCKKPNDIGKGKECYLKVSDFSFDAVRTALKMHDKRVRLGAPAPQPNRIRSLSIDGGLFGKQTLQFNEDLNCLIGIRGSGKSTCLEILRHALGLPLPDTEEKGRNRQGKTDYKEDLVVNGLGSGGVAEVTWIMDDGSQCRARTILNQTPDVVDDSDQPVPPAVFSQAIEGKVLYFGQKDLENLGKLDVSKRFLDHMLGNQAVAMREETDRIEEGLRSKAETLKKFDQITEDLDARKKELAACAFRLNKAKELGFADKLARKAGFERDRINLQRLHQALLDMQRELGDWVARQKESLTPGMLPALTIDKTLQEQVQRIVTATGGRLDAIEKRVGELAGDAQQVQAVLAQLDALFNAEKEALAAIEREIAQQVRDSHGIQKPLDFAAETRDAHNLGLAVAELERKLKTKDTMQQDFDRALQEAEQAWHGQWRKLKEMADRLNERNDNLRITVKYKGDKAAFRQGLEDAFRGSGMRKEAYDSLVEKFDDWKTMYQQSDEVAKLLSDAQYNTFQKILLDRWHELVGQRTPDATVVEFKDSGQFRPLSDYSIGQRASALLLFLIARDDVKVLMIDQPEDDLDSQTLYEKVIKTLLKAKSRTQFIFVTHNPNIPVLGDAEQVFACTFSQPQDSGPRIEVLQGGIDNPEIQQRVVRIMEGGEDAFNRRKEIYQLWK